MKNSPGGNNDKSIIDQVLGGHINAFEHLVTKYRAHVFKIVSRHVPADRVEETAQDVFIRAYQGLAGFSHRSGFKQWLSTIAIRASYDCLRRAYRSREIPFTDLAGSDNADPEYLMTGHAAKRHAEQVKTASLKEMLDSAMAQLKPQEKIVLELVYLEGFSMREAADLLGWSVANVKIRSYRARKKLNAVLKQG